MNPEAVQWLESLSESARVQFFSPAYPFDGKLYSFKLDHESCYFCAQARHYGELLVVE